MSDDVRRSEDITKLRALERNTNGRISVTQVTGNPVFRVGVRFKVRTAANAQFPRQVLNQVDAIVELGADYPWKEPIVRLTTPVFNPNVWPDGRVCTGYTWLITEYLDLLMQRVFKVLAFDGQIVNVRSAANLEAAKWYEATARQSPNLFPTDRLSISAPAKTSAFRWSN